MTFAVIQVEPFVLVQMCHGDHPPEPVLWPDGTATHGASAGVRHAGWMLAPCVYTPDQPNEFYQERGIAMPSCDGTTVTLTRDWQPLPVAQVQATLTSRIDAVAEGIRAKYLTPGSGQAFTYLQKLAEARAYLAAAKPVDSDYPLLNASLGIEGATIADVAAMVTKIAALWTVIAAAIETARLGGKAAIGASLDVEAALAAFNAIKWPA